MRWPKKLIEQAYTLGAQLGLSVWCEDEAGPFQAVPHSGVSWQPRGRPATQPHEYIRGGTTKILTLFHPATGQVRLQSAACCTNAVLHPWLRERLSAILAELPPDFRAAVVLCDIEGLSYEEIADVLGLKLGTVRSRIHRGRTMLRKALAHRAPVAGRSRYSGPAEQRRRRLTPQVS